MPKDDLLVSIDAPHFNAGIIITDGVVTDAAPILKYMIGWTKLEVWRYMQKKGWKVST